MASAGAAAESAGISGTLRRRSIHTPVPTPPANPPNQLNPPRLSRRERNGASLRNSTVHTTFAPIRPPMTPAIAASIACSGNLLYFSSLANIQIPANAPAATSTPNVVTSKSPMRKRIGYNDEALHATLHHHGSLPAPLSISQVGLRCEFLMRSSARATVFVVSL